jgi:hypothetical protein
MIGGGRIARMIGGGRIGRIGRMKTAYYPWLLRRFAT